MIFQGIYLVILLAILSFYYYFLYRYDFQETHIKMNSSIILSYILILIFAYLGFFTEHKTYFSIIYVLLSTFNLYYITVFSFGENINNRKSKIYILVNMSLYLFTLFLYSLYFMFDGRIIGSERRTLANNSMDREEEIRREGMRSERIARRTPSSSRRTGPSSSRRRSRKKSVLKGFKRKMSSMRQGLLSPTLML